MWSASQSSQATSSKAVTPAAGTMTVSIDARAIIVQSVSRKTCAVRADQEMFLESSGFFRRAMAQQCVVRETVYERLHSLFIEDRAVRP